MRHSARFSSLRSLSAVLKCLAPCLFLAAFLMTGCGGGGKDEVSGTVKTKKGKKISGQIVFIDKDGKEISSGILDGKYTPVTLTKGKYDVVIKPNVGGTATTGDVKPGKTADKGEAIKDAGSAAEMGVAPNKKYETKGNGLTYDHPGGKKADVNFELDD